LPWEGVAGLDVGVSAAPHGVAHFQAVGSEDVAFLAVLLLQQRDVSRTVGVVLDGLNGGVHADLVPLEVDDTVFGAVSAAAMANGDAPVAVTAGFFLHGLQEALFGAAFGKAGEIRDRHLPSGRAGRAV